MSNTDNEKHPLLSADDISNLLDTLYQKALDGIPKVSKSVDELSNDYLILYRDPSLASKKLIKNQIAKCGTSGFITGLGGVITLPVTIPANISSVIYVQLRMIAAIAKIGGFDIYSDQVQTMAYACLTGQAITDIVKQTGMKVGEKFAVAAIKKIPGTLITKINKAVGFRLLTRFGTKGVINIVKMVPVAGGVIGGAFDVVSTKIIANNAYSVFIKNIVPVYDSEKPDDIIETEFTDIVDSDDQD